MYVSAFVIVLFCVGPCYMQAKQRKLVILQKQVDELDDQALNMRVEIDDMRRNIDDLQSWKNTTETDVNTFEGSPLTGSKKKSLETIEKRVFYMLKGLEGEKMVIRQMMEDIRAEVRQYITKIRTSVDTAIHEHGVIKALTDNSMETQLDVFSNITERLDIVDSRLTTVMESCEVRFKNVRNEMEKVVDAKLNLHMLTTNEQLNLISNQLISSGQNYDEALEQLKKG